MLNSLNLWFKWGKELWLYCRYPLSYIRIENSLCNSRVQEGTKVGMVWMWGLRRTMTILIWMDRLIKMTREERETLWKENQLQGTVHAEKLPLWANCLIRSFRWSSRRNSWMQSHSPRGRILLRRWVHWANFEVSRTGSRKKWSPKSEPRTSLI